MTTALHELGSWFLGVLCGSLLGYLVAGNVKAHVSAEMLKVRTDINNFLSRLKIQ